MKRLAVLVLVLASATAQAHDLWIERAPGGLAVCYGHARSQHEGAALIDLSPESVLRIDCFQGDGSRAEPALAHDGRVLITGGCAAAFVLVSTGYWTKTPVGTKNVSKREASQPIRSWRSVESAKRIDAWGDPFSRPLTRDFEITVLEDPLTLRPGSKIRLLVTLDGSPVKGAAVTYDGETRGVTGQDGRVNLKIRRAGFQVIQAGISTPLGSDEADETVYTTNLNFEIGESQ